MRGDRNNPTTRYYDQKLDWKRTQKGVRIFWWKKAKHKMEKNLLLILLVTGCKAGVLLEEREVIMLNKDGEEVVRVEELMEVEEVVVVREGDSALLSCNSPTPWFFCAWSWGSERACLLQEGGGGPVRQVCGGSIGEVEGSGQTCGLSLARVKVEQSGNYLCMLSQGEELETVRRVVRLEVATPAILEVSAKGRQVEGGVVEALEGEVVQLSCESKRANPSPSLSWSAPWQDEDRQGGSLQFTAHTALTGLTISCKGEQGELYSSSLPLLLVVHPAPQALHSLLSPSSAPTVAVIAIILSSLLLLVIILLLVKLQRSKMGSPPKSPPSPWPVGSGLAPGLTSTPSSPHPLLLDGDFVSFSPVDMYGGGDSLLDAADALYPPPTTHYQAHQRQAKQPTLQTSSSSSSMSSSNSIDFRLVSAETTSSSLLTSSCSSSSLPPELTLNCQALAGPSSRPEGSSSRWSKVVMETPFLPSSSSSSSGCPSDIPGYSASDVSGFSQDGMDATVNI